MPATAVRAQHRIAATALVIASVVALGWPLGVPVSEATHFIFGPTFFRARTPWSPRVLHGAAVLNQRAVVFGGSCMYSLDGVPGTNESGADGTYCEGAARPTDTWRVATPPQAEHGEERQWTWTRSEMPVNSTAQTWPFPRHSFAYAVVPQGGIGGEHAVPADGDWLVMVGGSACDGFSAGYCSAQCPRGDVWVTNDAVTWTRALADEDAPWDPHEGASAAFFRGRLFLVGGASCGGGKPFDPTMPNPRNEVWATPGPGGGGAAAAFDPANGVLPTTWTRVTPSGRNAWNGAGKWHFALVMAQAPSAGGSVIMISGGLPAPERARDGHTTCNERFVSVDGVSFAEWDTPHCELSMADAAAVAIGVAVIEVGGGVAAGIADGSGAQTASLVPTSASRSTLLQEPFLNSYLSLHESYPQAVAGARVIADFGSGTDDDGIIITGGFWCTNVSSTGANVQGCIESSLVVMNRQVACAGAGLLCSDEGGVCDEGRCVCHPGWGGVDCSVMVCEPPCPGLSECIQPNVCSCDQMLDLPECLVSSVDPQHIADISRIPMFMTWLALVMTTLFVASPLAQLAVAKTCLPCARRLTLGSQASPSGALVRWCCAPFRRRSMLLHWLEAREPAKTEPDTDFSWDPFAGTPSAPTEEKLVAMIRVDTGAAMKAPARRPSREPSSDAPPATSADGAATPSPDRRRASSAATADAGVAGDGTTRTGATGGGTTEGEEVG